MSTDIAQILSEKLQRAAFGSRLIANFTRLTYELTDVGTVARITADWETEVLSSEYHADDRGEVRC